jgi:hypothetical protein
MPPHLSISLFYAAVQECGSQQCPGLPSSPSRLFTSSMCSAGAAAANAALDGISTGSSSPAAPRSAAHCSSSPAHAASSLTVATPAAGGTAVTAAHQPSKGCDVSDTSRAKPPLPFSSLARKRAVSIGSGGNGLAAVESTGAGSKHSVAGAVSAVCSAPLGVMSQPCNAAPAVANFLSSVRVLGQG